MIISLPIVVQQDIKSYNQYALPLCVAFTERNFFPWIYKQFIQIKSAKIIYSNSDHLDYCLRENETVTYDSLYKEIMDIKFFSINSINKISDITDFIRKSILNGNYILLWMDDYFIKVKNAYNSYHLIHPSLIYGVDGDEKIFAAVGFTKKEHFESFTIDFDEIIKAVNKMCEKNDYKNFTGMYQLKLKQNHSAGIFTRVEFLKIVHDYLHPYKLDPDFVYGYDVYSVVLQNLINPLVPQVYIKYNTIHLLYEHKKTFYKALQYNLTGNSNKNNSLMLEEYLKVINAFEELRFLYIKSKLTEESKDFGKITSKQNADKLYNKIISASETEKQIVLEIYDKLCEIF